MAERTVPRMRALQANLKPHGKFEGRRSFSLRSQAIIFAGGGGGGGGGARGVHCSRMHKIIP